MIAATVSAAEFTDRIRTAAAPRRARSPGRRRWRSRSTRAPPARSRFRSIRSAASLLDDEPPELTQARLNAKNGGYATALERLEQIDRPKLKRDLVRRRRRVLPRVLCRSKQALGGKGEVTDAGRKLNEFVRRHPDNFHYLEAVETMGDLLMSSDKFAAAQRQYAELAKAPWPDYKMRAGVLLGRTLQAQGKHPEAIEKFDSVLASPDESTAAKEQKLSATLGKAVSLAEDQAARPGGRS